MSAFLLGLAGLTLLVWSLFLIDIWLGWRRMVVLADVLPPTPDQVDGLPLVSIIIPARNEAAGVEKALASVLTLDYPKFEVIAVDDRSEDSTGEILDRLAADEPRLRVEHVVELPAGWLGKNHALQTGAQSAVGEFLLFTDADVMFETTVLARAMRLVQERGTDHLTAACDIDTSSPALELFVATFALFFNGYFRPWRVNDPKKKEAVGIGAFNLVRTSAWRHAGTHEAIALDADDDLRLGRLLRDSGASQLFVLAGRLVHVEWYPTLREAVRGLEKNALAAVDYSYALLMAGLLVQLAFAAWPFIAIFLTSGATRLLNLGAVAVVLAAQLTLLRATSLRAWTAFALPIGTCMVVFTLLRAAILARVRGGIRWRGTFHSLDELKRR